MKINFEIDCTPKEAREFFGLPDLEPLQQELMSELEKTLTKNLSMMDGEALMKTWFTGWQDLQQSWSSALTPPAGGRAGERAKPSDSSETS